MHSIEKLTGLSGDMLIPLVATATKGADDGELFIENAISEQVVIDDGQIKSTAFSNSMGFGLRRVVGEFQAYACSNDITIDQIKKSAAELALASPSNGTLAEAPKVGNLSLYPAVSPLGEYDLPSRIKLVQDVDAYIRGKDNRVRQVQVTLSANVQDVMIVRPDGHVATDMRPMVVFIIVVTMDDGTRSETGMAKYSRRESYKNIFANWQSIADEALRQTDVLMQSIPCPAGEMHVILAKGDSGVLFHEAVGHGIEADLIRTGSSFSGMIGKQVASKGVTVIDDGTIEGSRGSINIDDEGTPTEKTVLIEDGILVNYMKDRFHGRFYGGGSTGNGRRQTYRHRPIVRMRNTFMENGDMNPDDIIANTKRGVYAVAYSGGQVDPMAGTFVFQATEAYLVENGKIVAPVKGATLIGSCREALKNIDLIGNDFSLEEAGGTCGKSGQGAPVNDGMPTIRLTAGITVGGTDAEGIQ